MFQRCVFFSAVILVLSPLMFAATANYVTVQVPQNVPPVNGRQMYAGYCASCHGMDGRGHGLLASRLTVQPADLTQLSRTHQGKYPSARVMAVIEYGGNGPNASQMPAWHTPLRNLSHLDEMQEFQRAGNLCRYIKKLQAR